MNMDELLKELTEDLNEESASKVGSEQSHDELVKDAEHKVEVILGKKFPGKIETAQDIKDLISLIKKHEEAFIPIIWGTDSPKKKAEEIEDIIKDLDDEQLDRIANAYDRSEVKSAAEKKVYSFISSIEEKLFKRQVDDISGVFGKKAKDDGHVEKNIKKRFNIIMPIRMKSKGKDYYGILRPAGKNGERGVITWQFNVKGNEGGDKSLPISLALIRKNENSKTLTVMQTKKIKADLEDDTLAFFDDKMDIDRVKNTIIDIMQESGKKFRSKDIKDYSKEELVKELENSEVPTWVFESISFWSTIKEMFNGKSPEKIKKNKK